MQKVFLIVFTLLCGAIPVSSFAQEAQPQAEVRQQVPTEIQSQFLPGAKHDNLLTNFAKDQVDLWKSPLRIKRGDVKWLVPLSVGAVALLATDHKVSHHFETHSNLRPASLKIGEFGGGASMLGASGGMWAIGKLTHSPKLAETGMLAGEAVAQTELVTKAIKWTVSRTRPDGNAHSFPSGHASSAFALASVVAHQYRDKPLIGIGAYSFAAAMSMSRITGRRHFPSDVLIGAAIGELIGRYIIHRHAHEDR